MKKCKLGDLFEIKQGYAFKSEKYLFSGQYVLCTLGNISADNNFKYDLSKANYYPDEFSHSFILKEGDLIIPLTEQAVGLFGNTAFVPQTKEFQFVLNQRVGKVIPKRDVADKYYLHYLLSTELVRNQIEATATGTSQRNTSPEKIYDVTVWVPDIEQQRKIGKTLFDLERKVNKNNQINDNLQQMAKTIYDYWFTQFDFPGENGKPYHFSGGQMVWNEQLKREIPAGWAVGSIVDNPISSVIKPGVEHFTLKEYLATAEVNGTAISTGTIIDYDNRESRANMQPTINSVWFAKMKNSIKHLFLNKEMQPIIDGVILSTGFCGIQCEEVAFEYISSFISSDYFEIIKDILAHGATQEAVNNEDMLSIRLLIPDDTTLSKYHEATKAIFSQISKNICENRQLIQLRDWLLPMLMNGQATVTD